MAVEIIGEDENLKRKVMCRNCGAVLEYLPVDTKSRHVSDYSGDSERECYVECPRCKRRVTVKE